MQTLRKVMRVVGRLLVFLLLAVLCTARLLHPAEITRVYQIAYEHLRQTLMMQRLILLPQSRDIPSFFQTFMWIDIAYEVLAALVILSGKRSGGWMIFFWYLIKMTICFAPYAFKTTRIPFTFRQRYEIIRNIAVLGVSLALTHIYRPVDQKKKSEAIKQS